MAAPPPLTTSTSRTSTVTATCHCTAITLTIPRPIHPLNECHCSICRRHGALWAYYRPKDVHIQISDPTTKTDTYVYGEKNIVFHRCKTCGCLMYWMDAKDGQNAAEMGFNANMLGKEEVRGLERVVDEEGEGQEGEQFKVNNVNVPEDERGA